MHIITQEDIKNINNLYYELKTYAAVARATGFSPGTVKKYVIKDYAPSSNNIKKFDKPLPEFDTTSFRTNDWDKLCVLSDEEVEEIKDLWKELDI